MAYKIRLATKQKRTAYARYLHGLEQRLGGMMLQDADKMTEPAQEPAMNTVQMGFLCPHGFEPAAFMIVAIDRQGKHFTNAPPQEALALRLGTIALDYVSQRAVLKMQEEALKRSPIITAPAGSLPPFPGPAGRG